MRLAALTGVYVGVVCSAQIGAQKIVELPLTGDGAPGGTYLVGLALALIELAHLTAPTRAEGFRNAQVMVAAPRSSVTVGSAALRCASGIRCSTAAAPSSSCCRA